MIEMVFVLFDLAEMLTEKSKTIIEIILFVLHQQFFPYLFTVKSIEIQKN